MKLMADNKKSLSAQEIVDENNDETVELSSLSVEDRLARIETVLESFNQEIGILLKHTHDAEGFPVVRL